MDYQWSVFQADLDPVIGHEQAGRRPVLVVSAEPLNIASTALSALSQSPAERTAACRVSAKFYCLPALPVCLPTPSHFVIKCVFWTKCVSVVSMERSTRLQ